ncbi:MAG: hypothetical protein HYZ16_04060 [Bacteroidetes bacterium]|nr:hypothetical protein [Bacteroidota bacterium]
MKKNTNKRRIFGSLDMNFLSTRSLNILSSLGGVHKAYEHFQKHGTFLNRQNAGRKVNDELKFLCNQLEEKNFPDFGHASPTSENDNTLEKISSIIWSSIQAHIQNMRLYHYDIAGEPVKDYLASLNPTLELKVYNFYIQQKSGLTIRSQNILKRLEKQVLTQKSQENITIVLREYFDVNNNFLTIPLCGIKSSLELLCFRENLLNYLHTPFESIDSHAPLKFEFNKEIVQAIKLNHDDFKYVYESDSYLFLDFVYYVLYNSLNKNSIKVLKLFDQEQIQDQAEIAKMIGITKERVRQIFKSIKFRHIPKITAIVKANLPMHPKDMPHLEGHFLCLAPSESIISPYGQQVCLKGKILEWLFASYYYPTFVPLSDLLDHKPNKLGYFSDNFDRVLINNTQAQHFNFAQFLNWVDSQIHMHELTNKEIDLEETINHYLANVAPIPCEIEPINLINLLNVIKLDKFSGSITDYKRILKRKEKELLKTTLIDFFLSKNEAVKTKEILNYLTNFNSTIYINKLLRFLANNDQTFVPFGIGQWGLKTWTSHAWDFGSIKKRVEMILMKHTEPVHISIIINLMNIRQFVSDRSLRSNLRMDSTKKFTFFNCGFIGLSRFRYDDKWFNIPRLNARIIANLKSCQSDQERNYMIDKVSKQFGYPKIHLEYLLNNGDPR